MNEPSTLGLQGLPGHSSSSCPGKACVSSACAANSAVSGSTQHRPVAQWAKRLSYVALSSGDGVHELSLIWLRLILRNSLSTAAETQISDGWQTQCAMALSEKDAIQVGDDCAKCTKSSSAGDHRALSSVGEPRAMCEKTKGHTFGKCGPHARQECASADLSVRWWNPEVLSEQPSDKQPVAVGWILMCAKTHRATQQKDHC